VPALKGDTVSAAEQLLRPLHFQLRANPTYNDTVATGQIISQVQSGLLPEGSTVAVAVSQGPPPVTVPDLTGLPQSDAGQRLIGAGLKVGAVSGRFDNTAPKGTVLSWTGSGGQLPKGSPVDLVISNGPPVVPVPPNLAGQSFAAAQSALAAVNLKAAETEVFSTSVPKGQVISTSPAGGAAIPIGATVTVNVSKGPDLVAVPDVKGQSVGAATQALQNAGFAVSGVTGNPLNTVIRTSPPGGALVLRGSSVALFTS
jgi:serine/threonine-protein kinase